jgi:hypothetical protein
MQARSWMAALIVAVGSVFPMAPRALAEDKPAPATYKVAMNLNIAGLGPRGCDVEVKPGHGGCRFNAVSTHIDRTGLGTIQLKDVRTTSPDRACAFAITIREAGHPDRTVRRGIVLSSSPATRGSTIDCYLKCPSELARAEQEMRQRR